MKAMLHNPKRYQVTCGNHTLPTSTGNDNIGHLFLKHFIGNSVITGKLTFGYVIPHDWECQV